MSDAIVGMDIEDIFNEKMSEFGVATVKARAIPSIEDAATPVVRRILYAIHEEKLAALKYKKAAKFVGQVMANYHPHGDLSIYDTMVGLSQTFTRLNPLLDSEGNNGKISGDRQAAMRYLELRLSKFSRETLLGDLNEAYIPFKDNYDASMQEPEYLPSAFPLILNLGVIGIASGFATNILPHRVQDICEITKKYITNPDIKHDDLIKNFRPDFPSGGIILNEADLPAIYKAGRGIIRIQSRIEFEKIGGKDALVVKDLPYKVTTNAIMEQITSLCKPDPKSKAPGLLEAYVGDMDDYSDKKQQVNLVIWPKKDVSCEVLQNMLLEHTQLRNHIAYNCNVLKDGELAANIDIKQIVAHWTEFRVKTLQRKYAYEIAKYTETLFFRRALLKIQGMIDKVIDLIKKSTGEADAIQKVAALANLTEKEAKYIVNIKLYQISATEVGKLKEEIKNLEIEVQNRVDILSSEKRILDIIKEQLTDIAKKFATERRTELTNNYKGGDFDVRDVIESEDLFVAISKDKYVYARPVAEMKDYAVRGGKGKSVIDPKYNKVLEQTFTVNSHDDLLVFTDTGKVINVKGYQMNLWHKHISNAIEDIGSQAVVAVLKIKEPVNPNETVVFITADSLMKRVAITDLKAERRMKGGNIAIKINEGDYLVAVAFSDSEEDTVLVTTSEGRCQKMLTGRDIELMLRPTSGRGRCLLREGEVVVSMDIVPESATENAAAVIVTAQGKGKAVALTEVAYRRRDGGRGGLVKIATLNKGDNLIAGKIVTEGQSVIVDSANNKSVKLDNSLLSSLSRQAKGNRLITLEEGDSVANVTVV
jgi:DNA gyrase subunit A